uniref:GAG-pre-integrase domain-containing protein n=1 Tax=Amphimedon queenslandica TaxID=400682 RepID=A0A1X7UQ86_AMPQE
MHNVLYLPKLSSNLFSVRESASNGNSTFFGSNCWIRNRRKQLIGVGLPVGKLYRLDCTIQKSNKQSAFTSNEKSGSTSIDVWHRWLAHVNIRQLQELCSSADEINISSRGDRSFCEACIEGKMHRLPHHPLKEIKSTHHHK